MSEDNKSKIMQQVVTNHLNSIPSGQSNEPRAFIEAATLWLGKWWKLRDQWKSITPGYCVLVLDHEFSKSSLPKGFGEKKLFRDAPDPYLGGSVFVSDFSLTKVFQCKAGHTDADSICKHLEELNLHSLPCVLFSPETGLMLVAEKGISHDLLHCPLFTFDGSLSTANIDRLMDNLYNSTLKYRETFPHIWFNANNFVPIFEAEKLFQNLLYIHFKASTQGSCVVVREDQTNAGRTDLSLTSLTPQVVFVMEMKVLKSFSYEGHGKPSRPFPEDKNEAWANSGIDQVIDYRVAKQANEAYLLLYDMRKQHSAIPKVSDRCAKENVNLRKFDIFNKSARDIRNAS